MNDTFDPKAKAMQVLLTHLFTPWARPTSYPEPWPTLAQRSAGDLDLFLRYLTTMEGFLKDVARRGRPPYRMQRPLTGPICKDRGEVARAFYALYRELRLCQFNPFELPGYQFNPEYGEALDVFQEVGLADANITENPMNYVSWQPILEGDYVNGIYDQLMGKAQPKGKKTASQTWKTTQSALTRRLKQGTRTLLGSDFACFYTDQTPWVQLSSFSSKSAGAEPFRMMSRRINDLEVQMKQQFPITGWLRWIQYFPSTGYVTKLKVFGTADVGRVESLWSSLDKRNILQREPVSLITPQMPLELLTIGMAEIHRHIRLDTAASEQGSEMGIGATLQYPCKPFPISAVIPKGGSKPPFSPAFGKDI